MCKLLWTVFVIALIGTTTLRARMPTQKEVFTISSYTHPEWDYFSTDDLYSALPFFREITEDEYVRDVFRPEERRYQAGMIVLKNKKTLTFLTQSEKYLRTTDSLERSAYYKLDDTEFPRRVCPKRVPRDDRGLPRPEEIFCAAVVASEGGPEYFSPHELIAALPRFRPRDAPLPEMHVRLRKRQFGVLVLADRTVLGWVAENSTAISFSNYRVGTHFVLNQ